MDYSVRVSKICYEAKKIISFFAWRGNIVLERIWFLCKIMDVNDKG